MTFTAFSRYSATFFALLSLVLFADQDETGKVVAVMSAKSLEDVAFLGKATAPKNQRQIEFKGVKYWAVHHEGYAGLIDPACLNTEYTSLLISNFKAAFAAYSKENKSFSIAKNCPAFMDKVLMTLNLSSVQGISAVYLEPEISIEVTNLDKRKVSLRANKTVNLTDEKIALTIMDIGTLKSGRDPVTILPFHYSISALELVPSEFRQPLEEKLIRSFWEIRNEMDAEYQAAYQDLAGVLSAREPTTAKVGSLKGKTIVELAQAERRLVYDLMESNGALPNEWQSGIISDVTARLMLRWAVFESNGKVYNSSYRIGYAFY